MYFLASCTYVQIISNAPAVVGSTINFRAVLYNYNPSIFSYDLEFDWEDNAIPRHTRQVGTCELLCFVQNEVFRK